jgi:hypothetical protein
MGLRWLLESLSPDTTLVCLHSMGPLPLSSLALHESPGTFGFGNLLPNVGENPRPSVDILRRKEAETSDRRFTHPETHFHRILTTETLCADFL